MDKNNRLFVDSNFFIALFNPTDALNQKALTISKKLKKENPRLYISNFVFLEVVTVLSQRVSRKAAISLGNHLLKDRQLEIIHIDKQLNKLTWKIFQNIKKKNVSFVDCSILAAMKAEGIKKLLTFDQSDFLSLKKYCRFGFYK
ncbi:PIN domain-containing protein [Candidatus Microgenomates bacterium]|nr:PIN domain-containing protein [Candidatus Microgenomates bacterium]